MKKILKNSIALAVVLSAVWACTTDNERLDTIPDNVAGGGAAYTNVPNRAYMNKDNAMVIIPKATEGGIATIEPRLSGIASKDTKITINVADYLAEYNRENSTEYEMLPLEAFELYEENNPTNVSTNGIITATIKAGESSSKIVVKVKPLNTTDYPMTKRYAIPVRISSTDAAGILSNNDALVTFQRPFTTSVAKIQKGRAIKVKLASDIPASEEFTIQTQIMFLDWAYYSGVSNGICTTDKGCRGVPNMTLMNLGYYTRIQPGSSIQVKDGGADGADTNTAFESELNTWYQFTFTYSKATNDFKVYVNGEYIGKFARSLAGLSPGQVLSVQNPQNSYSPNHYMREVRVWNRVLSDAEIKDKVYLPLNVETSKGLVAYIPIDPINGFKDISKYDNQVIFYKGTGRNTGVQDGNGFIQEVDEAEFVANDAVKWIDKVKFPSDKNKFETAD